MFFLQSNDIYPYTFGINYVENMYINCYRFVFQKHTMLSTTSRVRCLPRGNVKNVHSRKEKSRGNEIQNCGAVCIQFVQYRQMSQLRTAVHTEYMKQCDGLLCWNRGSKTMTKCEFKITNFKVPLFSCS